MDVQPIEEEKYIIKFTRYDSMEDTDTTEDKVNKRTKYFKWGYYLILLITFFNYGVRRHENCVGAVIVVSRQEINSYILTWRHEFSYDEFINMYQYKTCILWGACRISQLFVTLFFQCVKNICQHAIRIRLSSFHISVV